MNSVRSYGEKSILGVFPNVHDRTPIYERVLLSSECLIRRNGNFSCSQDAANATKKDKFGIFEKQGNFSFPTRTIHAASCASFNATNQLRYRSKCNKQAQEMNQATTW